MGQDHGRYVKRSVMYGPWLYLISCYLPLLFLMLFKIVSSFPNTVFLSYKMLLLLSVLNMLVINSLRSVCMQTWLYLPRDFDLV